VAADINVVLVNLTLMSSTEMLVAEVYHRTMRSQHT